MYHKLKIVFITVLFRILSQLLSKQNNSIMRATAEADHLLKSYKLNVICKKIIFIFQDKKILKISCNLTIIVR